MNISALFVFNYLFSVLNQQNYLVLTYSIFFWDNHWYVRKILSLKRIVYLDDGHGKIFNWLSKYSKIANTFFFQNLSKWLKLIFIKCHFLIHINMKCYYMIFKVFVKFVIMYSFSHVSLSVRKIFFSRENCSLQIIGWNLNYDVQVFLISSEFPIMKS